MQVRAVIFAIGLMIALLGIAMIPSALLDIAENLWFIATAICKERGESEGGCW